MGANLDPLAAFVVYQEGGTATQTGRELLQIAMGLEQLAEKLREVLPLLPVDTIPVTDTLASVCDFPRARITQIVKILMSQPGRAVSDETLVRCLNCTKKTLVVYTSHARKSLVEAGFEPGILRVRGRGYYIPKDIADRIAASLPSIDEPGSDILFNGASPLI